MNKAALILLSSVVLCGTSPGQINVPDGTTRKITLFSRISDSATVNVASGGTLQVLWSDDIGALTGTGHVRVDIGKLTILGVNSGPFSGTLANRQSLLPTSTEFRNSATALNASISNLGLGSSVFFNGGVADASTIQNDAELSSARFENGALASNGTTINNGGWLSFVTFDGSTADAVSIFNNSPLTWASFDDASTALNGTTINNVGNHSWVAFSSGSTADDARISNTGDYSLAWFGSGSSAANGTTIDNVGLGSQTRFVNAHAQGVTITNAADAGAVTSFEGESTGTAETTVQNEAGGLLDLSLLTVPDLTIGRVFGDGDIELGWNHLAVGSQDAPEDTIGGAITGEGGSLTKEGSGTLILTGTSSIGGRVSIDDGTLELNGFFSALEGFHVGEDGALTGSGTVDGDLFNAGSVEPGNSPGILLVTGDYVQSAGGSFVLEVGGSGPVSHDQLVVEGTATLNGTLRVVPLSPASYGDRVDFLQAAGGVTGAYDRVVITNPDWFRGRFFKPSASTGSMVIAPASYKLVGTNPNDISLAHALDQWIGVDEGDIGVVTLALDHLRADQFAAAFAAIQPGYYAGALNTQLETSHYLGRMLNLQFGSRRLAHGPAPEIASGKAVMSDKGLVTAPERGIDLWVQGSGLFSSGGLSLVPGAEFDGGNLLVGAGVALAPGLEVGFYGDFGEGWTDVGEDGSLDYDRSAFGGYAVLEAGRFYAWASAGGGAVDFEIDRPIPFGSISRRATGRPESSEFLGLATVGYELPAGPGGWFLEPQASLQYSSAELDEMTEEGAGALNLHLDDAAADSFRTYLGGRLAKRVMLKSGGILSPYLHAHWVHEYLREGDFFHATLDSGNGPGFRYLMADPSENSVYGGIGLNFWNPEGLNINVNYNADWGRANTDHGVSVGVGKRF